MPISEGRVAFRLPAAVHREAKRAAAELGLTVSGWIRMIAIEALRQRGPSPEPALSPPPEAEGTEPPIESIAQCACGWRHDPDVDEESYSACPACGESF